MEMAVNDGSNPRQEEAPRIFTLEEVSKHNSRDSCWMVIFDEVYDVTSFLKEHPAGEEILLQEAGGDATESFQFVGHSMDAVEILRDLRIGVVSEEEKKYNKDAKTNNKTSASLSNITDYNSWHQWVLCVGLVCVAFLIFWSYK